MGLLKEAMNEQAAAKVGIFGRQGSGKTTTGILIGIGLSKAFHGGAPIALMDTENASDFVKPICDAEGVKLLVIKSRAFADMKAALKEAEAAGCCAYQVDSYSHPWKELCDTFKAKSHRKRLEFHHMDELKTMWGVWTAQFLNSPLHVLLCGRLGFEWGEEEDGGERKLVKLGTKMKSESEAGYEPNLLVEMESFAPSGVNPKTKKRGAIINRAFVLKDRWRALNGLTFDFPTMNAYKKGDYEPVFKAFMPHWKNLVIGTAQRSVDNSRTSSEMFTENGESVTHELARRKQVALEETKELLGAIWPGQSEAAKTMRRTAGEALFGVLSWTAVEGKPLEDVEDAVAVLREYRSNANGETPDTIGDTLKNILSRLVCVRADAAATTEEVGF